jgi:hypothetical protein
MKKEIVLFISILILASCNPAPEKKVLKGSVADSIPRLPLENETTALDVTPAPLPASFILDTLSVNDTAKHLSAFFHFPVSNDEKLNKIIVELVKKNTHGYEDYHPGEFESASVEAWVSSFAVTGRIISMIFTDQSFSTGAAHFNHGYTALNYDTLKKKQIGLLDIFNLQNEKEKQAFCDSILSPEINADMRITVDDVKKEADIFIEKGKMTFFFDDYEKGPSMTSYSFDLKSVRSFVKKDYQWLVD